MRNLLISITLVASLLLIPSAFSDDTAPYLAVGSAKTRRTVVALPNWGVSGNLSAAATKTLETIKADLLFMDLFQIQDPKTFTDNSPQAAPNTFKMDAWSGIGTEFLVKATVAPAEKGLTVDTYVYQVAANTSVMNKRYLSSMGDIKTLAHTMADDIVKAITGTPGIFRTKIAMICDRTGKKEVYIMDFDGSDTKQLTKHRSITLSPAWSPDATRIAYSLIAKNKRNVKNTNLYEFNIKNNTVRLLSDRHGINSGAHYNPMDGKRIALTMSFLGNPEIFSFDPETKSVTRLTNHPGIDVDPNWSNDGKYISFVSNRHGASMIYRMNSDGSNVQRLTFAGSYNATPAWSPAGNKIGFAGWIDGRFDIFIMNTDGTNIERLTKSQGNNEDPSFSPDGNFIVFSSNRAGQKNIYAMNIDGTFVKRLTYGMGNCTSPRWSSTPK